MDNVVFLDYLGGRCTDATFVQTVDWIRSCDVHSLNAALHDLWEMTVLSPGENHGNALDHIFSTIAGHQERE